MKGLIYKLTTHAGYLERYRSGDQRAMAGDIRDAIAALEVVETENAALRARVAELEGMVPNNAQLVVDVALLRDLIDHGRKFESFGNVWITEQLERLTATLPADPKEEA